MFRFTIDEDLEMRLLEDRHAEEVYALTEGDRAYFREWLTYIDDQKSVEDVKRMIRGDLAGFANQTRLQAGIWFQGKLVGIAGLDKIDWDWKTADMSYMLAASFQGRGIITKCCRALVAYAFDELGLNRVEIRCAVENTKSREIPKRLGFTTEGTLRQAQWVNDRFVDHVVYGMLAADWHALHLTTI